jgi:hypothetical protein
MFDYQHVMFRLSDMATGEHWRLWEGDAQRQVSSLLGLSVTHQSAIKLPVSISKLIPSSKLRVGYPVPRSSMEYSSYAMNMENRESFPGGFECFDTPRKTTSWDVVVSCSPCSKLLVCSYTRGGNLPASAIGTWSVPFRWRRALARPWAAPLVLFAIFDLPERIYACNQNISE